jgi:hypothetical protein
MRIRKLIGEAFCACRDTMQSLYAGPCGPNRRLNLKYIGFTGELIEHFWVWNQVFPPFFAVPASSEDTTVISVLHCAWRPRIRPGRLEHPASALSPGMSCGGGFPGRARGIRGPPSFQPLPGKG